MVRFTFILPLVFSVSACSPPPSTAVEQVIEIKGPSSRYDELIHSAAKEFLPIPTKLFGSELYKAQLYQESLLDPDARSPAGAEGIAQFMPATWKETMRKMGIANAHPREADIAIRAGAYYMSTLRAEFTAPRAEHERMELSQAAYNTGLGNVLKAQQRCGGLVWEEIRGCLPTGRYAQETITYVERIWRFWEQWKLG